VKSLEASGAEVDELSHDDLGALIDLGRYENYIGITMAFVVLDRFLMDVLNAADSELDNCVRDEERPLPSRKNYFKEFKQRLEIDLDSAPFDGLRKYRDLRDQIAHQGGQTRGKRDGETYVVGSDVTLTSEDVRACISLVGRCCEAIEDVYSRHAAPKLAAREALSLEWVAQLMRDDPPGTQ
jgi:hypothetical protein